MLSRKTFSEYSENKSSEKKKNNYQTFSSGYQLLEAKFHDSFVFKLFSMLRTGVIRHFRFKHEFSKKTEESHIYKSVLSFCGSFLSVPLRNYGIFSFFLFISSLFVCAVTGRFDNIPEIYNTVICLSVLFFVSVFFSFSSKSLGKSLSESRIISFILFTLLNCNKKSFENTALNINSTIFVFVGAFSGFLTFFLSLDKLLTFACLLAFLLFVFFSPEDGVLTTLLLLPFLNENNLLNFVFFCVISYFSKVLRSKRILNYTLFDVVVLLFILLLFGFGAGIVGTDSFSITLEIILFLLFGIVIKNTIKTTTLSIKCVNALVLSVSFLSITGIFLFIFEHYELNSVHYCFSFIFELIRSIPSAGTLTSAEFSLLILPFCFSLRSSSKSISFLSSIVCIFSVILSLRFSLWVSLVASILLYICFISPILFLFSVVLFALLFIVNVFFPGIFYSFQTVISYITDFTDFSDNLFISISHALDLVREFHLFGIGIGGFDSNYASSNLSIADYGFLSSKCPSLFNILVYFGFIGFLLILFAFSIVILNCTGLFYHEKICNINLKRYVLSCMSTITFVFLSSIYMNFAVSHNLILFILVILFLSFSFRKASEIEYAPEIDDYLL